MDEKQFPAKMTNLPDRLLTNRLSLHLITEKDSEFLYNIVNSEGWLAYIGDRNVRSIDEATAYIRKLRNTENLCYWVVHIEENDVAVGIVSFLKRDYLDNFDIGFALLPEFNGNGYAYEATSTVLSVVSQNPAFRPVFATTIPTNQKSIKLLEKLGFYLEKEIKVGNQKMLVYAKYDFQ